MQEAATATPESTVAAAVQTTPLTLGRAIELYLDAYDGRDENRPYRLGAWVRFMGHMPLTAITIDDVEDGLAKIAAEPSRVYAGKDADGHRVFRLRNNGKRSNSTVNRYYVALCGLYAWARKARKVPRDFVAPTKHIEKRPEPRGRVRYLKDTEREALLAACRESSWPRLYLLVLMAITTGARRGELLSIRWCDMDLERGEARVGEDLDAFETKNSDARTLILLPAVLAELGKFKPKDQTTSTALVFRSRLRPSQAFHMKAAWSEALAAAGIKDFRFHDLRHTCASYAAQQGASLLELADLLGHRTMLMVKRYSHLSTDSKRRLVARTFAGVA